MSRVRAQGILGLVSAHWWVKMDPGVCGYRAMKVSVLVPAHWCVWLGPDSSIRQG